jgi:23S rRNA (pseudouridine1915-N3)-methyltransferase
MQVYLLAVGKAGKGPESALFQEYTKRLPWKITVKEVEEKRPLPPEKRKASEAELLLAACPPAAVKFVLDEKGKAFTSEQFAAKIADFQQQGRTTFAFFIGGPDGHGEALKKSADVLLAFGSMTWPHMMVRAMLAEQVYRAHSILSGHPYHRS